LKWAEAVSLTDAEIEDRLFLPTIPETKQRPLPDFNYIYDQLRAYQKFNLTLASCGWSIRQNTPMVTNIPILRAVPCWRKKLDYCMRQEHRQAKRFSSIIRWSVNR